MTFERARAIADAVLLEGYVLYPYRASALKNRYRWSFGVLAPRPWSEAGGGDPFWLEAQCLLEATDETRVRGRLRLLQLQQRSIFERSDDSLRPVESLDIAGRLWLSWDEAVTQEVDFEVALEGAGETELVLPFALPGAVREEPLVDDSGNVVGAVRYQRWPVSGVVQVVAEAVLAEQPLARLRVRVENLSPSEGAPWHGADASRDDAMKGSCLSTHLLLAVSDGAFLSLMDPPEWARHIADTCKNVGTYPVLVGEEGQRDLLLASPIILYDHPRIAPESPGDFYDASEIDELLTLRTRTLTDEEKRQVRATDPRSESLLERVEGLPRERMERLHGAVRELESCEEAEQKRAVDVGARVRLRGGKRRTDAQDLLFVGRIATVEKLEHDVDGRLFVAVTFEEDPAADLNRWYGRYHYYELDEVELLPRGDERAA